MVRCLCMMSYDVTSRNQQERLMKPEVAGHLTADYDLCIPCCTLDVPVISSSIIFVLYPVRRLRFYSSN